MDAMARDLYVREVQGRQRNRNPGCGGLSRRSFDVTRKDAGH